MVWCTVVHMGGWTNGRTSVVGCCAVMLLGPRLSDVLSLSLLSLLFATISPFSVCPSLSLAVSLCPVLPSYCVPLLTIRYGHFSRSRLYFPPSTLHSPFSLPSVSFSLPLSSSSRRTCLLEGPELAGGHYGGYSVGFSVGLSKAHERVCPPRVKELPREQVHLLPYLSSPLLFPLLLLFLSLSPFPFPRYTAYHWQAALCPLRFVP